MARQITRSAPAAREVADSSAVISTQDADAARYRSDRLVLGRSPQDEAIEELAEEQGWQRSTVEPVWAIAPGTSLSYVEDPVSRNAYAVLVSDDREAFDNALGREPGPPRRSRGVRRGVLQPDPGGLRQPTGDPEQKLRDDAATLLAGFDATGVEPTTP